LENLRGYLARLELYEGGREIIRPAAKEPIRLTWLR
jgi:hypothetical protein